MKKGNLYLFAAAAALVLSSVSAAAVDIQTSGWVRFRDQLDVKSGTAGNNTQRNRVRVAFQYGGKAMVAENVEAGFGISSVGDARSFNQTLGASSALAQPALALDYAYIKHTRDAMSFTLGRFKNPFYSVSQLIWDADLRSEGAAVNYNWDANTAFTGAWYPLKEQSGSLLDSNMVVLQASRSDSLMDTPVKGALTYYGTAFASSNGAVFGGTELTKELAAWDLAGEATFSPEFVEKVKGYGEFVVNANAPDTNKNGWLLGVTAGNKKLSGPGSWEADLNYRYIQQFAFIPQLVDSDFLAGTTRAKGWTGSFKYAIDRDLIAGISYRQAYDILLPEVVNGTFQLDISTKF